MKLIKETRENIFNFVEYIKETKRIENEAAEITKENIKYKS